MTRNVPKLRIQFIREEREDIVFRALDALAKPRRATRLQATGRLRAEGCGCHRDTQITVFFEPAAGLFSNWEVRAIAEWQAESTESTESMRFLRYSTARRYFEHLVAKYALEVTPIETRGYHRMGDVGSGSNRAVE